MFTIIFALSVFMIIHLIGAIKLKMYHQPEVKINLEQIFYLFSPDPICIYSNNDDLLQSFIEICLRQNVVVTINNLLNIPLKSCGAIVTIGVPAQSLCTDFLKKFVWISVTIYVLDSGDDCSETVRLDLEQCHNTVEVVRVCLTDGSMTQLSPMWTTSVERHFTNTTVQQLLTRPTTVNLEGATVTAAISQYVPYSIVDKNSPGGVDGLMVLIFKEFAHQLNFSLEIHPYGDLGVEQLNGTWSGGVMKQLVDGNVDLSATMVWQIPSFYKIVEFGPTLEKIYLGFIVRRPVQLDFRWQNFITIFKPEVWFATFIAFFFICGVYWFALNCNTSTHANNIPEVVLIVFGHFFATTSHIRLDHGITRFIFTAWSAFSLLFTTYLSTGIVSRLMLPLYSPRVDTVQQLVEGQFSWTSIIYSQLRTRELKSSVINFENKWQNQFEKTFRKLGKEEMLEEANKNEKLAILAHTFGNDYLTVMAAVYDTSLLRRYRLSEEKITSKHVTFAVKKHSPLFKPFTSLGIRFLEAGLPMAWLDQVIRRWPLFNTKHIRLEQDIPSFGKHQPLSLSKLRPVFYLLILGLIVSGVRFIVELNF